MKADYYSNMFRDFLASKHISQRQAVDKWNEKHPEHPQSYQGLNNKLRNNTLRWSEVLEMLEMFGYTVSFVETDSQPGQLEGVPLIDSKGDDSPFPVRIAAERVAKDRHKEYVKAKKNDSIQ